MKKYQTIKTSNNAIVGTKTIAGLKKLIEKRKESEGVFFCTCPSGNVHKWEIKLSRIHVHVGYAFNKIDTFAPFVVLYNPRKKSARVGKGINKSNYTASYVN